jgi:hypothetical protein
VVPRVVAFTPEVVTDGNGRSGREVGNDGFRIAGGQAGCRDGEVGEASGDDTRGRDVLTTRDIVDLRTRRDRRRGVICAKGIRDT